jgi:nucleotide sugar dehydrogenase
MVDVCVIGLGRIGLPLALLLAKAQHRVMAVDSSPDILRKIRDNSLDWAHADVETEMIEQFLDRNFFVTDDLHQALSQSTAIFVAIGTGVGPDGSPDLSNIYGLMERICINADDVRGRLFVLKSTLPIGTTRKVAAYVEEKTGLKCGKDFSMVFCPERVLGDRAISEMASLPKVIGGIDKDSSARAARIYETIGGKIIVVDRLESAEMIKLLDNSYRQTMFAFANDFALLAELHGINAYEVIRAANDNYPRNNIPFPSGGVSGYCLTKDPLYLEASFREVSSRRGFSSVWLSARKTNDYMPNHMIDMLKERLASAGKELRSSTILVCGVAYKENTDDIRSSHGLEIARKLQKEGAIVLLWDPNVHGEIVGFEMIKNLGDVLESLDAMVFTVGHKEFAQLDLENAISDLVRKMRTPVVIDGCGLFQRFIGTEDVYYAGVGIPRKR